MKRNLLLPMMLLLAGGVFGPSVKAQNWTGATISDAKDKTVYLWNVGAKQFLGKGGRWGTEAVISNVGTPFIVEQSGSSWRLKSVVKGQGSTTAGYLGFMNGVNSEHDKGDYYVDRAIKDFKGNDTKDVETTLYTVTATSAGNTFKVTSSNTPTNDTNYKGTFILFANMAGDKKAKGVKTIPIDPTGEIDSTAFSQWIIVTEKERQDMFEKAEASSSSAVPATFLMLDNGFDRNDNNVTNWEVRKNESSTAFDGELSNGNTCVIPSEAYSGTTKTYTYTYTGKHNYSYYNRYYTHTVTFEVKTKTAPENMPQTLTIPCSWSSTSAYSHTTENVTVSLTNTESSESTNTPYTYYVGNGYDESQTYVDEDFEPLSAKKYWQELYGGDWTANIHGSYGVVKQSIDNDKMLREGWYKVSCVGFTTATEGTAQLYVCSGTGNDATTTEYYAVQDLTKINEKDAPATYVKASKLINGGGYEASAMVYIDENKTLGKLKQLSFGIMVKNAESTAWTCFDNFQIDYLGKPSKVLVLDEDQTDVDYINKQTAKSEEDNVKRTLYLHRTVNAKKWNSIVLPVSLTVGQAQSAFGDNFKLSKFKGATNPDIPGRMYFEAVNINRDKYNDVAIEEGKLYIIKPEKEEPTGQKEVEFPEATKITDKLTSYFTIVGVTFNDKRKDFEPQVKGDPGDETYNDTQVQFVGTYVANKDGEKLIPANSYVLRGNKDNEAGLWFYRTEKTKTKGFRGWLETLENTNASKISFSINGVVSDDEATGIDAIDAELNGNAVNGNVYNLSGQLVRRNATSLEGLAKGVYIHNGKKFIVK